MANADCIVIQGSNMAECHPVGFQWVEEAKARGARVIHVDPRFTRTSAVADKHIPIRAGSDVVLLGALINYVLANDLWFTEYVIAYTNAATLVNEDFRDTEELGGLFSGFDPDTGQYDPTTWAYAQHEDAPEAADGDHEHGASASARAAGDQHGSGGPVLPHARVLRDETLQDPRTVFQILKRHYARYTPEMVRDVCGVSLDDFAYLARSITENSGRERTTCFAYAVGWTQHTLGAQFIRGAAILQLLLGNMGRPGGGIMALRGHASIQGSTDIPTLFNLLPGYLPMPSAGKHDTFADYLGAAASKQQKGFWAAADTYIVSLFKAWWGDAARADNDWAYDYLPRLTGPHGTYQTVTAMLADEVEGYFLLGQNPAVGSANGRQQRLGMSHLKWLVVRDLNMIESATWWKDGPEIATGELRTEDIATEVFFMPAASHVEKAGTFTQTQRLLQWRHKAIDPPGECQSELDFFYQLGQRIRQKLADSTDERDRPLLGSDLGLSDRRGRQSHLRGRAGGDQRLPLDRRRRPRAALVVHRAADRRIDDRRLLDLHRGVRRRRQPGGRPGAWRRSGAEPVGVGLGLAGQPADPLQPGLGRPGRQAVERTEELGLVGRGARPLGGRRRARLRARPRPGQPSRPGSRRSGRARRRRPVHHAVRRQGMAVRPQGHDRRAAARALRAAGVPGRQRALPAAAESRPDHVPADGQPQRARAPARPARTCTRTCSPPTG